MARIRTIKPDFWKHEDLSALPEPTHMLAAALLNYADDYGYFNANVGLIRAECSPLREPSVSIQDSINLLINVGYLQMFAGIDGKRYGRVVKFEDHQRVNRPTASKIKPLCGEIEPIPPHHAHLSEPSSQEEERKGREEERNEGANAPSSADAAGDDIPDPEIVSRAAISEAMNLYCEAVSGTGLPKPRSTKRQRALIGVRLKSHGLDDWREMCAKIRGSPFLLGNGGTWPGATLDWVCNLTNFEKILDGNYDRVSAKKPDERGAVLERFLNRGEAAGNVDSVWPDADRPQDGGVAGGEPVPHLRLTG